MELLFDYTSAKAFYDSNLAYYENLNEKNPSQISINFSEFLECHKDILDMQGEHAANFFCMILDSLNDEIADDMQFIDGILQNDYLEKNERNNRSEFDNRKYVFLSELLNLIRKEI